MLQVIDRVSLAATIHLLLAGVVLMAAGVAGLSGTVPLVALLLGITVALFAVRDDLPSAGYVARVDTDQVVREAWISTALAATTTAVGLGAEPGELTALGGVLGLVAMANYFLRPVYYVVYSLVGSVLAAVRPENG